MDVVAHISEQDQRQKPVCARSNHRKKQRTKANILPAQIWICQCKTRCQVGRDKHLTHNTTHTNIYFPISFEILTTKTTPKIIIIIIMCRKKIFVLDWLVLYHTHNIQLRFSITLLYFFPTSAKSHWLTLTYRSIIFYLRIIRPTIILYFTYSVCVVVVVIIIVPFNIFTHSRAQRTANTHTDSPFLKRWILMLCVFFFQCTYNE